MDDTFLVVGEYDTGGVAPDEGTIVVTPSTMPLVEIADGGRVIQAPIRGNVDRGQVRIELPALGLFEPEFSLKWQVWLNSGFHDTFEFMPEPAGVEIDLNDVVHISLPIPPGTELQFSQEVLAARDAAIAAQEGAEDALAQIIELGGTGTIPYHQAAPSSQWNLGHPPGLRRQPVILLDDEPTRLVETDTEYVSDTLTILIFPTPVSGWAYL